MKVKAQIEKSKDQNISLHLQTFDKVDHLRRILEETQLRIDRLDLIKHEVKRNVNLNLNHKNQTNLDENHKIKQM